MTTRTLRAAGGGALLSLLALAAAAPSAHAQAYPERLERAGHVLRRLTFGPTFAGLANLILPFSVPQSVLVDAFVAAQLDPDSVPETAEYIALDAALFTTYGIPKDGDPVPAQPGSWSIENLAVKELARSCFSARQLQEKMTYTWQRHFSTSNGKIERYFSDLGHTAEDADHLAGYHGWVENEGFRENSLGTFKDLLYESAMGVPMLIYLDNVKNQKPVENQNYARELLELHTLGLDECTGKNVLFTFGDILEIAKSFTGWTVVDKDPGPGIDYQYEFDGDVHIEGARSILANVTGGPFPIPEDNDTDSQGRLILDILAGLPETAEFVSKKLYAYFVDDEGPMPTELLDDCKDDWGTDGDISAVLGHIFSSAELRNVTGQTPNFVYSQVGMPIESLTHTIRALEGTSLAVPNKLNGLRTVLEVFLGQSLFRFGPPDGFPSGSIEQVSTQLMLGRIRYNQELYNALDFAAGNIYGGKIAYDALGLLTRYGISPTDPFRITDTSLLFVCQDEATPNDLLLPLEFFTRDANGNPTTVSLADLVAQFPALPALQEYYDRVNQTNTLVASYVQSMLK